MMLRIAIAAVVSVLVAGSAGASTIQARAQHGAAGEALCLDVAGSRTENGADLILYRCHGGRNQEFAFDRRSGEVRSALGAFCVDVFRGEARAGTSVHLWTCNGSPAQRFRSDPATGALVFAADPRFCIDITGDAIGGGRPAALATCNGSAAQRLEVSTRHGDRRFDELTSLTSHNAFVNPEDSRWTVPNQSRGIARALRDGVRGFMLDVWSFESGRARCILSFGADCYPRDLYLCHGDCGAVPGIQYALPRQTLSGALSTITEFLWSNPEEIVTVFLEDYSQRDELARALDRVPHLRELLFDPYAAGVTSRGWPRAADMVNTNRRLLIISDNGSKRDLGVGFGPDLTVENHWSMGGVDPSYACTSRWGSIPLDRQDPGFARLFVMNHFRDLATPITASTDNSRANLTRRMNDFCLPAARRKPNYIAVDYYDRGDAAAVAADVDDSTAILFQHGDYSGRAQLLTPGLHWLVDLTVGNDAVSSLKVLRSAIVTLYDHEGFQGASRSFTASAPSVGDFNDRTSSVSVGEVE